MEGGGQGESTVGTGRVTGESTKDTQDKRPTGPGRGRDHLLGRQVHPRTRQTLDPTTQV